ncbi:MAG: hypothetical protein M3N41_06320, partial [Acidobacteriota bacterium]|nr:hypothetical protein [Acidobacteriota bacterium]
MKTMAKRENQQQRVIPGAENQRESMHLVHRHQHLAGSSSSPSSTRPGTESQGGAGPAVRTALDPTYREHGDTEPSRIEIAASSSISVKGESIFSVDVEDWFHIIDIPAAPQ